MDFYIGRIQKSLQMRNHYKKLNLFLIILILTFEFVFPQNMKEGVSLSNVIIKNYLPKDYKAHNQNWSILKGKNGKMYFGNSAGVLEFDGYNWKLIKVPNGVVRSLSVDNNGTIFVGSADDFGYLEFTHNGGLEYKSLLSYVKLKNAIGHVWYMFEINGSMIFITNQYIIKFIFKSGLYNDPAIEIFEAKVRYRVAHKVNNEIYILESSTGLLKFDGKEFHELKGSKGLFEENNIYSMLPYGSSDEKILIASRKKGFYVFDGINFTPFKTEADDYVLEKNIFLPGAKLPDGTYAFNTSDGGIILINSEGSVIRKFDMSNGILDDGVLFLFHSDGKLWVAMQNGISAIEIPSDVAYLNQSAGLKGAVSSVKVINNVLFAATTAGVFKLDFNKISNLSLQFEKLREIADEAWWIIDYKKSIIFATTQGIHLLNNNSYKKVNTGWRGCYYIYQSKVFKNRLYVGLETGLAVLEDVNGNWIDRGKIEGINTAVRNIEEDEKGNLWLGTSYSGVFRVSEISDNLDGKQQIVHFNDSFIKKDEEVKLFPTRSGLLFSTKTKVLQFDYASNSFIPESSIGFNEHFSDSEISYILEDSSGNFWVSAITPSSELSIAIAINNGSKYEWREVSSLKNVIDYSNSNAVFSIFKDERSGIVWFNGADGIVSFNSNYLVSKFNSKNEYSSLITKVTINSDSLLFMGDDQLLKLLVPNKDFRLEHDFSSIRFEFSSLKFEGNLSEYQFILEGLNNSWSGWSSENRKDYTNLSPGSYVFRVRAKDINNNISRESTFSFTVSSPWFTSRYAYLAYLIFLIAFIYSLVQFRVRYLTQKNIKLESVIAVRTKLISEQAEKLKELDEVKSRFFTNISHEFRTPLTLTLGQIESVMSKLQDSGLKKKLQMGHLNARKLLKLINQILEISKIESGKQKLLIGEYELVTFIRNIFYSFESVADQKGLTLNFCAHQEFIKVYFEQEKMERVFNNIISNAIKFTNAGGKINLNIGVLRSDVSTPKEIVEIILSDSGIGIPKDRLPYIFDRFYQADRLDKSDIEGTGIGLTLTKELVELHYGKIEVQSDSGKGTVVKIQLPLGKDHFNLEELNNIKVKDAIPENEPISFSERSYDDTLEDEPFEEQNKESVLVIDDNADIRQFIKEQLEEYFSIYEASDGVVGIKLAQEVIPNLIITDVRMPGIDGYEVSRKLKHDTLTSHIPIIILTAKSDQVDKLTGLETGADDYLVKPFSPQELLLRVKNLISTRKKLQEKYSKRADFTLEEVTSSSIDRKFLSLVINEINNNLSQENFSTEILADKCAISVSQLNRKLNALIGQPAGQLIRSTRMEKAAKMLEKNEIPIKEIAFSVGYSDQSNFSRSFKKYFGKTPGEFTSK